MYSFILLNKISGLAGKAVEDEDSPVGRVVDDDAALKYCLDPGLSTAVATATSAIAIAASTPTGDKEGQGLVTGLVSGRMWDFLRLCDPTSSFAEQAEAMECTLDEVGS